MINCRFDPRRRRLRVRFGGFWDTATAQQVKDLYRDAIESAIRTGPITLLDDMLGWTVQSQDVVAMNHVLADISAKAPILRNAIVVETPIVRMQIRRTTVGLSNCSLFSDLASADAWLAEVEPRPDAAG